MEWNHLCYFGRRHYGKQESENVLNLDQRFRRCCLKDFLSRALAALMFSGAKPFMQFGRGHYGEQSHENILNLDQWFQRRCLLKKKFTHDRQSK